LAISEKRIFILSAIGPVEVGELDLRDEDNVAETIFCCYFRTEQGRSQLIADLKTVAGDASAAGEFEKLSDSAEYSELIGTIHWWAHTKRKPYHVYKLKAEFLPYHTSCAITFAEPEPNAIKLAVLRSLQILEQDKSRVHEFFGFDSGSEIG